MSKVLFITGASSGIGRATAQAAVESGWRVGLMARREEALREIQSELGSEQVEVVAGDATDLEAQRAAVEAVAKRWGQVDAAFANAGTGVSQPGTENGDPQEWRRLVDINIMGVLYTAKAVLLHLRETTGHFVVTSSVAGRLNPPGSVYSATKWFVHGFGQNLAGEMARWGGRCTIVAPGMVNTAFFDDPKPDKLAPEDIAASVMFALNAPARANVREVFIMPTN
ncbi:MAG: SDR family oxidoreductase [Myxococcota bacterium]